MINHILYTGGVMIRFPLHRGCHDQTSSTQGVMIRCPLGGCHDQISSTQGVS